MKQHWWCDYCEVCLTNHIKVLIFYDERVFCLGTHCRKQQGTQSDIMPFTIGGLEASTDIYALTGIFKIPAWTILITFDGFYGLRVVIWGYMYLQRGEIKSKASSTLLLFVVHYSSIILSELSSFSSKNPPLHSLLTKFRQDNMKNRKIFHLLQFTFIFL